MTIEQQPQTPKAKKSSYWVAIILALVFIIPIVLAWTFFNEEHELANVDTSNYGHLILPPPYIEKLALKQVNGKAATKRMLLGKWRMLYINPNGCEKVCRSNLYKMRQVRIALGKNQSRVARIFVSLDRQQRIVIEDAIAHGYTGTALLETTKVNAAKFLHKLPSAKMALKQGYLYLVDPHGNVMMSYAPNANSSKILKDMKKLLRVSQIG